MFIRGVHSFGKTACLWRNGLSNTQEVHLVTVVDHLCGRCPRLSVFVIVSLVCEPTPWPFVLLQWPGTATEDPAPESPRWHGGLHRFPALRCGGQVCAALSHFWLPVQPFQCLLRESKLITLQIAGVFFKFFCISHQSPVTYASFL